MPTDRELWQSRYDEYLQTDKWAELRSSCLDRLSGECVMCSKDAYTAHHRHYNFGRFGAEDEAVLVPICRSCHHKHHNPYSNLDEVRKLTLKEAYSVDGCKCSVCNQKAKVYKQKMYTAMGRYLIAIVLEYQKTNDWISIPDLEIYRSGYQRGNYGYLKHWKLIEKNSFRQPIFFSFVRAGCYCYIVFVFLDY